MFHPVEIVVLVIMHHLPRNRLHDHHHPQVIVQLVQLVSNIDQIPIKNVIVVNIRRNSRRNKINLQQPQPQRRIKSHQARNQRRQRKNNL